MTYCTVFLSNTDSSSTLVLNRDNTVSVNYPIVLNLSNTDTCNAVYMFYTTVCYINTQNESFFHSVEWGHMCSEIVLN